MRKDFLQDFQGGDERGLIKNPLVAEHTAPHPGLQPLPLWVEASGLVRPALELSMPEGLAGSGVSWCWQKLLRASPPSCDASIPRGRRRSSAISARRAARSERDLRQVPQTARVPPKIRFQVCCSAVAACSRAGASSTFALDTMQDSAMSKNVPKSISGCVRPTKPKLV